MFSLAEHEPIIFQERNKVYSSAGTIVMGYKLDLVEIYSLGEREYDSLWDTWYKMLRDLEPGTIVLKQDFYRKAQYEGEGIADEDFLDRATRRHFEGRAYMKQDSYLFFIWTQTGKTLNPAYIKSPFKKLPTVRELEEDILANEAFEKEAQRSVDFLCAKGMIRARALEEKELWALRDSYFNGLEGDKITDTYRKEDRVYIGNKRVGIQGVTSLSQLPEELSNIISSPSMSSADYSFFQGFSEGLGLGLPFDHVVNQVFYMEDHQELKEALEKKKDSFFGARAFSNDNKLGHKLLNELLEKMAGDEGVKLIKAHFNVAYLAEESEFGFAEGEVTKQLKLMGIRPYAPSGNILDSLYTFSFFGYISQLPERFRYMIDLQQACCMINQVGNYESEPEGVLFNDRVTNLPIRRDIWDDAKKRIVAKNFIVIAPTGGGKSVLCSHLLREFIKMGMNLVIHDLGDSYQKLCKFFPEDHLYIRYKEGEPLGINPFFLGEEELGSMKIGELTNFILQLWKREETYSTEEEVAIRKILQQYYEVVKNRQKHSFPHFYKFIKQNEYKLLRKLEITEYQFELESFLHVCSEFVSGGSYDFLFEQREQEVDLRGKRIVVFELGEAKEDPLLLSVLLRMSIEIKRKLIWEDRTQRGIIFYDEFAKFLQFPSVLQSVKYDAQAVRKYSGAVGLVLQSINQFPENSAANEILDNISVSYILKNDKGYAPIVKRLGLERHDENQLKSIRYNFSGERKYSEVFLKRGTEGNVVRLELAPEVLAASLTEGKEHVEIMKLYQELGDMEKAIKAFLDQQN